MSVALVLIAVLALVGAIASGLSLIHIRQALGYLRAEAEMSVVDRELSRQQRSSTHLLKPVERVVDDGPGFRGACSCGWSYEAVDGGEVMDHMELHRKQTVRRRTA